MKKRRQFGNYDANATTSENKFGLIRGARPTARDGHISIVDSKGYMYVFGGDRHLMPFNDLYMIKLQWREEREEVLIIGGEKMPRW